MTEIMEIRTILAGVFLAAESLYDIKKRHVHTVMLLVSGLLAAVTGAAAVIEGSIGFLMLAAGILPGGFLLFIAKATREAVGYGDGLALIVAGLFLDVGRTLNIFILALFLSALAAIIIVGVKKAGRKDTIPFLPFLFLGYCLIVAVGIQGG